MVMSARDDLKIWMVRNDKTVIDVASFTGLAPQTVRNFLNGENVNRSTLKLIEQLVRQLAAPPKQAVS